jgi:hypothetical protein
VSVATKRLAEYGIIGSKIETLGSVQARTKAFGKVPASTHGTWEERLMPLERTLSGRKQNEETKKKDSDELGLRKLL